MIIGETIVARATPEGQAAIGIIRVSGPESGRILGEVFRSRHKRPFDHPRSLITGVMHDRAGNPLDEVMVAYFAGPRSYTGEDMVEIHCHGGEAVIRTLLDLLQDHGAREARRGEFSQRSFENGKRNLLSVEAILQLIRAGSREQVLGAMKALGGEFERELRELHESLSVLLARIEACLDFSEEPDVQALVLPPVQEVRRKADQIQRRIRRSVDGGIETVIAGRPNVGKSSLMNAITGKRTSIVTDEPGTTRDVVRSPLVLNGHRLEFVDTAGIEGEHQGLEKKADQMAARLAREQIERGDLVLWVTDRPEELGDSPILGRTIRVIRVLSKCDLLDPLTRQRLTAEQRPAAFVTTSASTGEGIDSLLHAVQSEVERWLGPADGIPVSVRQARSCRLLDQAMVKLQESLDNHMLELAAIDLRDALRAVGQLLGQDTEPDVLARIFDEFCVGK